MIDPITALSAGLGLAKSVHGMVQRSNAKKIQENNPRPEFEISDKYYENEAMYEVQAQSGFTQDSLARQNNLALNALSKSLSSGLQAGMTPNQAGDFYSQYLAAMGDTAVKNVQLQFANINNLAKAKTDLAAQEFIEFGYNRDAPYKDRAQLASAMSGQSTENIFGGLDAVSAGIIAQKQRGLYEKRTEALEQSMGRPLTLPQSVATSGEPEPPFATAATAPAAFSSAAAAPAAFSSAAAAGAVRNFADLGLDDEELQQAVELLRKRKI